MTDDQREIRRKLRVLAYAELSGDVSKACRYFGVGRASFHRWRQAYRAHGEAGLVNKRSVPHNHPNKTPMAIVEKVLHLRRKCHLGPMRIVWYLERYHGIRISDAGVYRILCRNGLNRLPTGTRVRKVHMNRYNKQVPGHHIQIDVKFPTFDEKDGKIVRWFQYTVIEDATRIRALKVHDPGQCHRLR
jgi:transposase